MGLDVVVEQSVARAAESTTRKARPSRCSVAGASVRPSSGSTRSASTISVDTSSGSAAKEAGVLRRIAKLADDQSPIYVWGTGTNALHLLASSRLAECNIVAFLDSNPHYAGKQLAGRLVKAPRDVDDAGRADPGRVGGQPDDDRNGGAKPVRARRPTHPDVLRCRRSKTATGPDASSSPATPGSRVRGSPSGSAASAPRSPATRSIRRRSRTCSTRSTSARASATSSPTSAIVDRLTAEVQAAQPSVIFHLAARALVRRAYEEPRDTFETNVMGTVNVLEAARACPSVRAVVIVTSDKVLREPRDRPSLRRDRPAGWPRPVRRQQGRCRAGHRGLPRELLRERRRGRVRPRRQRHRRRRLGARPDHPGLRARPGRRASPIVVRNPDAIRPWQHVLEPLSGYLRLGSLLLADGHRYAGAWNFGPTKERSDQPVRWVVDRFLAEWGSGSWTTPASTEGQPHEAQRLSLDSTKAREQLGWAPVWDPSEAVRRTASWYREYYRAPASARALVEHELEAYQDDARAAGLTWAGGDGDRTTR